MSAHCACHLDYALWIVPYAVMLTLFAGFHVITSGERLYLWNWSRIDSSGVFRQAQIIL